MDSDVQDIRRKPNVPMFSVGSDIEKQLPVINKENWFSRKGRAAACVFDPPFRRNVYPIVSNGIEAHTIFTLSVANA